MAEYNNGGNAAPARIVFEHTGNALRNAASLTPDLQKDLVALYARVQRSIEDCIKNTPPGKNLNVYTTTVTDFIKEVRGNHCYISMYGIEEISFYMEKQLVEAIGIPGTNIREATDSTRSGTITKTLIIPIGVAQQIMSNHFAQAQQLTPASSPNNQQQRGRADPEKDFVCRLLIVYIIPLIIVTYLVHLCISTDFSTKMEALWNVMPSVRNTIQKFNCEYLKLCRS